MNNTSNIPNTGFKATDIQNHDQTRRVRFNVSGSFAFAFFAVKQLLQGDLLQRVPYSSTEVDLFRKLTGYGLEVASIPNDQEVNCTIPLERAEVLILKKWLEARMQHCEKERAEDNSQVSQFESQAGSKMTTSEQAHYERYTAKFNPDTYIAQKFLLLDIREWLLGDVEE